MGKTEKNIGKNAGRNTRKTWDIRADIRKGDNTHKRERSVSKRRGRRTTKRGEVCRTKGVF